MRYIGSKTSSVSNIYDIVSDYIQTGSFCDPFGGTAVVSSFFKNKGYEVFTGDVLEFAHNFQVAKLVQNRLSSFNKIKKYLNFQTREEIIAHFRSLNKKKGWFINNYALQRNFFTYENACKIQACWYEIIKFEKKGLLNKNEKAILISSLINSMDKVANTAGTYYAYLKHFDRKAKRDFSFELISPVKGAHKGMCYKMDALDLIKRRKYDVIYLDPPYNKRKYEAYYHLPETIAKCSFPNITGKAGSPKISNTFESDFYDSKKAINSLRRIIDSAKFKILIFHYQDTGLITPADIKKIFRNYSGKEYYINSLGYTTKATDRKSITHLYLFEKCQ